MVTAVVGAAGVVGSLGLGLGELTAPGPGLWPFVVSVVLVVLSAVLALVGRSATDAERFSRASVRTAVAVVTLVLLGLLLPVIGFEIPSLLLMLGWLRFLGKESWGLSIAISVGTVAVLYVLFVVLLHIPLPRLI